ncbi:MAG: Fe-S cluster assembly protein SufD [Candidatus Latescibacterota bacterium]|jgi:Fe-S cluster assembly protein SufD
MAVSSDARERYLARFADFERHLNGARRSPVHARRRTALARFAEHGFPTARDEDWRQTSLAALTRLEFAPATADAFPAAAEIERFALPALGGTQLVFIDGIYAPSLSTVAALPSGVVAMSLAQALEERPELLEELGRHAVEEDQPFTALNTAFLGDGAFVHLPEGTGITEPIHLHFLAGSTNTPTLCHPRVLILVGPGARGTVVESYAGGDGVPRLTNAVTEIALGEGADLDYYRVQQEGSATFHLADLGVSEARDARFRASSFALGSGLARHQVRTVLDGEGIESTLNGLYLAGGEQHLANHTLVEHRQPHGVSHELYKGILTDRATAVFRGRILVHQAAQQTDAYQANRNLLLSAEAEVSAQPQLEIYADDVKCSHGATVGRLDDEALFYLRSRGIGQADAVRVLTRAFAGEIVDRVRPAALREYLAERVGERLATGRP